MTATSVRPARSRRSWTRARALLEGHRQPGVLGAQPGHGAGDQDGGGGGEGADGDRSDEPVAQPGQLVFGRLDPGQDGGSVAGQHDAGGAEGHAAGSPLEQRRAHRELQRGDLA
jgi:hypothetical protein